MEGVFNSMRGLDVLQPLVDDPSITEIMINGPHHVFVEQSGRLYRKNVSFVIRSEERIKSRMVTSPFPSILAFLVSILTKLSTLQRIC